MSKCQCKHRVIFRIRVTAAVSECRPLLVLGVQANATEEVYKLHLTISHCIPAIAGIQYTTFIKKIAVGMIIAVDIFSKKLPADLLIKIVYLRPRMK